MMDNRPRQHNLSITREPRQRRRRKRARTLRCNLRLTKPYNNSSFTTQALRSRRARGNSAGFTGRRRSNCPPTRLTRHKTCGRYTTDRRLIHSQVRRLTRFNSLVMFTNRPAISLINKHNSSRRRHNSPARNRIINTPNPNRGIRYRRGRRRCSTQMNSRIQQHIPSIRRQ